MLTFFSSASGRTFVSEDKLGSGCYGNVYRVHDEANDIFALKTMRKGTLEMRRLVSIQMTLKHENVLQLIEHFDTEKLHCLLFPLCTKGIAHRDIKGENILLTDQDQVKLADFGLATKLSESKLDLEKLDMWPFGALIYTLLTTLPPSVDREFRLVFAGMGFEGEELSQGAKDLIRRCTNPKTGTRPTFAELTNDPFFKDEPPNAQPQSVTEEAKPKRGLEEDSVDEAESSTTAKRRRADKKGKAKAKEDQEDTRAKEDEKEKEERPPVSITIAVESTTTTAATTTDAIVVNTGAASEGKSNTVTETTTPYSTLSTTENTTIATTAMVISSKQEDSTICADFLDATTDVADPVVPTTEAFSIAADTSSNAASIDADSKSSIGASHTSAVADPNISKSSMSSGHTGQAVSSDEAKVEVTGNTTASASTKDSALLDKLGAATSEPAASDAANESANF
ncbi:hypothetical protein BGW39_009283 [Mortierella sp. 14UC]|nr:hypothetical protein BGW39_009283 [Mortierella sp. 14UC]